MIKAKKVFCWTSDLKGHGFHGDKATIFTWPRKAYQAFYDLKHYNLLEAGSVLIKILNQPTSCLMLQFKHKIHINCHLIAFSSKKDVFGPLIWVLHEIRRGIYIVSKNRISLIRVTSQLLRNQKNRVKAWYVFIICAVCKASFLGIGKVHQSYSHLNVWCWKRWIQVFSTGKTP